MVALGWIGVSPDPVDVNAAAVVDEDAVVPAEQAHRQRNNKPQAAERMDMAILSI
jgi:hypothetical protein